MDIYHLSLVKWGEDKQVLKMAEECSELAVECHHWVGRGKLNENKFAEEIADVIIMLEQMKLIVNPITLKQAILNKQLKLQSALEIKGFSEDLEI